MAATRNTNRKSTNRKSTRKSTTKSTRKPARKSNRKKNNFLKKISPFKFLGIWLPWTIGMMVIFGSAADIFYYNFGKISPNQQHKIVNVDND